MIYIKTINKLINYNNKDNLLNKILRINFRYLLSGEFVVMQSLLMILLPLVNRSLPIRKLSDISLLLSPVSLCSLLPSSSPSTPPAPLLPLLLSFLLQSIPFMNNAFLVNSCLVRSLAESCVELSLACVVRRSA